MPPSPAVVRVFGRLARALDEASDEAAAFEAARRVHEGFARLLRGLARLDAGRQDEARADARAACLDPRVGVRVLGAELLAHAGAPRDALGVLDEALDAATSPALRASVRLVRAAVEASLGRYTDAHASWDAAAPDRPADAWVESAELCARLAWHDEAVRRLDAALSLAPDASELHRRRCMSLVALGRHGDALAPARRALACASDAPEVLGAVEALVAAGDLDAAEAALSSNPRLAGERGASLWRARFAAWRGDLARAREALGEGDAGAVEAARVAASIALAAGEWREAEAQAGAVLAARPDDAEAGFVRAEARARRGDAAGAMADAMAARNVAGDHAAGYIVRLRVKLRDGVEHPWIQDEAAEVAAPLSQVLGDDVRARWPAVTAAGVDAALARMKGNRCLWGTWVDDGGALRRLVVPPYVRHAMGLAQRRLGVAPTAEVLAALDALVDAHGSLTMPLCYRGEVHLWLGDLARARADFEASIARAPHTRWAYIGLGAVETLEGHLPRAEAVFERGMNRAAPGPTLFVYRAEMNRLAGRRDEARRDLDVSLRQSPERLGARVNLALWHLAWGDRAEARRLADDLHARAVDLAMDARRLAGAAPNDPLPDAALGPFFEAALRMMRGNRSSSIFTWFTPEGRLRRSPPHPLDARATAPERRLLRARVLRAVGIDGA